MSEQKVKLIIDAQGETGGIMQFVAGLKKLQSAAKDSDGAFGGLANRLKGFIAPIISAVSLGAFAKLTKDSIDNADALSKQAQKAGMAVDAFSALVYSTKLSDASAEDMVVAMKGLSQWLEKTGQIGRDLTEVMIEQADVFARMPDGAEKVRLAQERFGRSGQALIPLLNQGSAAIREQMEEAREFGVVIGPRFSANSQQFNDNLTRFANLFRGIGNMLADAILPEFIRFQEAVLEWVKSTGAHKAAVDTLIQVYQGFALTVALTRSAFELLGGSVGTFFGNLSVTQSFSQAWKAAGETVDQTYDRLEKRFNQILDMGRKADEAQKKAAEPVDSKFTFDRAMRDSDAEIRQLELKIQKLQTRGAKGIAVGVTSADGSGDAELRASSRYIGTLEQEQEAIKQLLNEKKKLLNQRFEDQTRAEFSGFISKQEARDMELQDAQKLFQIQKEILALKERTNDFTFAEKLDRNLQDMADKFHHVGASIADVLTRGIGSAIDTVADGMWAVIDGTATWGQLFQQVGRSIVSDLIKIGIQELMLDGLKRGIAWAWSGFKAMLGVQDVARSNAQEAAKTPALAANATLASIGSWGVAVAVGVAAIAAIMASVGAFEKGGVIEGGEQLIRVNESGTESVLNARATAALGPNRIASLNAGDFAALDLANRMAGGLEATMPIVQPMSSPMTAQASESREQKFVIVLVDSTSKDKGMEALTSNEGRGTVINIVKGAKVEIGIPS